VAEVSSVEDVIALVRANGGRSTQSRRIVLEILFSLDDCASAEEIAEAVQLRAPDVHLSTVYRHLEDLQELGVVVHSHMGHGPATYQLAAHATAYLICQSCGTRFEAPDSMFRGLSKTAMDQFDFAIDPHHVAILGLCAACRSDT
jgi:Fur family transcriptional regulator, ferric uptake regulator